MTFNYNISVKKRISNDVHITYDYWERNFNKGYFSDTWEENGITKCEVIPECTNKGYTYTITK